jgi:hypothetical protein
MGAVSAVDMTVVAFKEVLAGSDGVMVVVVEKRVGW